MQNSTGEDNGEGGFDITTPDDVVQGESDIDTERTRPRNKSTSSPVVEPPHRPELAEPQTKQQRSNASKKPRERFTKAPIPKIFGLKLSPWIYDPLGRFWCVIVNRPYPRPVLAKDIHDDCECGELVSGAEGMNIGDIILAEALDRIKDRERQERSHDFEVPSLNRPRPEPTHGGNPAPDEIMRLADGNILRHVIEGWKWSCVRIRNRSKKPNQAVDFGLFAGVMTFNSLATCGIFWFGAVALKHTWVTMDSAKNITWYTNSKLAEVVIGSEDVTVRRGFEAAYFTIVASCAISCIFQLIITMRWFEVWKRPRKARTKKPHLYVFFLLLFLSNTGICCAAIYMYEKFIWGYAKKGIPMGYDGLYGGPEKAANTSVLVF